MIDFYRIATAAPKVVVANPMANAEAILSTANAVSKAGAHLLLTPELSLTGYTCGDLFGMASLEEQTTAALTLLTKSLPAGLITIVGLPIRMDDQLFNCAAVLHQGKVLGLVPKTHLPTYREFYEKRNFVSARQLPANAQWTNNNGSSIPMGTDLVFDCGKFRFGIEICEDLWAVDAPSHKLAAARAQLILNPSASTEAVGKAAYRQQLVTLQSGRLSCVYAYAAAGMGESTTDVVYGAHQMIANNGRLLAQSRWEENFLLADFNPSWLDILRMRETSFPELPRPEMRVVKFELTTRPSDGSQAHLDPHPFVPANDAHRQQRCQEIFRIQVAGLAKRFTHTHSKRLVIGLSGGLDSTLALLVCTKMCDILKLSHETILGVTMPGFGTSKRTRSNVDILAEHLGVPLKEISITPAVMQHFKDIEHDPNVLDVTYENSQARERTQLLMDLANAESGLVVGTGDLSEIALGWSTYNGDHMSMYAVNCGVPKTLVRYCVESVAQESPDKLAAVLRDICATPVSPELLPGEQHTESIVGQYELHDFFLYYFIKFACTRKDLQCLAERLLGKTYTIEQIEATLKIFARRFVQQQFKRSALPDGPKVGTIALSPRGDWRMPSDAAFEL